MVRRFAHALPAVAGLSMLFALTGCESGPPKLEAAHIVGEWVEQPDQTPPNPRMAPPPRLSQMMRKIVFGADGSFKLMLSRPDGSGSDESKSITGTWKLEAGSIHCEPGANSLGSNFSAWTPQLIGMDPPTKHGDPPANECRVQHTDGSQARYKRVGS